MSTIHVVFVDAATRQPVGESDLPADQLPESFAVETTLHLGGDDWQIEHAEPVTRAEAAQAGQLRLVIRQIERVDPKDILFSLPTIENALPPTQDGGGNVLRMREDDWRQVELIAAELEPEVAAELAAIRQIHAERQGAGFPRLHVRARIPEPLAGTALALDTVARGPRRPLGFDGAEGIVIGGFAFDAGDGTIYGREDGGRVTVLGAWRAELLVLADLAQAHDLIIVDWCAARLILT